MASRWQMDFKDRPLRISALSLHSYILPLPGIILLQPVNLWLCMRKPIMDDTKPEPYWCYSHNYNDKCEL